MDLPDVDPISQEPFRVPVVASDGHTYELEDLIKWVEQDWKRSSPMTRETLRPIVYWNEPVAMFNKLAIPKQRFFVLYAGWFYQPSKTASSNVIEIDVKLNMAQCFGCEWLAMFFETKELLRQPVKISLVLEKEADEKPSVVGYTVAANLKEQLQSFCKTFYFDLMFSKCDRMAAASVFVGDVYFCTLEELLNDPVAHAAWGARRVE